MREKVRLHIGLHSGPACDGVEAALVEVRGLGRNMRVHQVCATHRAFPKGLRQRLRRMMLGGRAAARAQAELDCHVGGQYVAAARALLDEAGRTASDLAAAGVADVELARASPAGGPGRAALRPAHRVAAEFDVGTVSHFADTDLAVGGRGHPITVWPHWLWLRDERLSRVLVRLGGVATTTFIPAAAEPSDVIAFDAAPAGLLLDRLAEDVLDAPFDADGAAAAGGSCSGELLHELGMHAFFRQPPPKAVAPADFSGTYLRRVYAMAEKHRCGGADLLATGTELVARQVAEAILALHERPHEVILAGGGARNIHLAGRIRRLLSPSSTYGAHRYGLDMGAVEAVAYAVLGAVRLIGFAAHIPTVTGATRRRVLGSVAGN